MTNTGSIFLTPVELSVRWCVDIKTIYKWLSDGKIKSIKMGRVYRIPVETVIEMEQKGF